MISKFLLCTILLQVVVNLSTVLALGDPTSYLNVKATVVIKLKDTSTAVATATLGSSCANNGEGNSEAGKCRTLLAGVLGATDTSDTILQQYSGAAAFYLIQFLLKKDTDYDSAVVNKFCQRLKAVDKCYSDVLTSPCDTSAPQRVEAEAVVYQDRATLKMLYDWKRYCTANGDKSALVDNLLGATTNKYPECIATEEGRLLNEFAVDKGLLQLRKLSASPLDEIIALVKSGVTAGDAQKTTKLKNLCYKTVAIYNEGFQFLFVVENALNAQKCPVDTQKLMFERIRAEIIPGIELACDMPDPTNNLRAARPNPSDTDHYKLRIISFQHLLFKYRKNDEYVSCKDEYTPSSTILFNYKPITIEGDFLDAAVENHPMLASVKVLVDDGSGQIASYTLANNDQDFPLNFDAKTEKTFSTTTITANGKKAKLQDTASGLTVDVEKVVVSSGKAVFSVTVTVPNSALQYIGGGVLSTGCITLNTNACLDGTILKIHEYDSETLPGSQNLSAALIPPNAQTTGCNANNNNESNNGERYSIAVSLSFILFLASIVKMTKKIF